MALLGQKAVDKVSSSFLASMGGYLIRQCILSLPPRARKLSGYKSMPMLCCQGTSQAGLCFLI